MCTEIKNVLLITKINITSVCLGLYEFLICKPHSFFAILIGRLLVASCFS